MSEISMYIMVIAAIGIGVLVISKRFLKKNTTKEFNYKTKKARKLENSSLQERMDFRNKGKTNLETERPLSFRDAFNRDIKNAQSISNVELNKTFWWALVSLVALVVLIIYL